MPNLTAYTGPVTLSNSSPGAVRSRINGALLGGALMEATAGSPEEFLFGDAAHLTLYTVDGLTEALEWANDGVAADEAACLWLAYLRWLRIQGEAPPSSAPSPPARWLDGQDVPHRRSPPDTATVRALASGEMGSRQRPLERDDDGPGALQRSAPFGLIANVPPEWIEKLALDAAAITHGNPLAQIPAAVLARLIHRITFEEQSLEDGISAAAQHAAALGSADLSALLQSPDTAQQERADAAGVLGEAVGLALSTANDDGAASFRALLTAGGKLEGPAASVVGSVAGSIAGALHGDHSLPPDARQRLAGADIVEEVAARFASAMGA